MTGSAARRTAPASRLLDLGAGTGTGALGLAERFPQAEVIAVDVEPGSLARLRDKAVGRGLAGRVRAVEADLDAGWPDLGPLDLTWASMSLHHLADPGRVLGDALAATRAGGLIAVAEFAEPLRFLPSDLGFGRPGFEERLVETLGRAHAEALPTLGSAWAPRLADAGWDVIDERRVPDRPRPAGAPARRRVRPRLVHQARRRGSPTSLSPPTRRRSRRCSPRTAPARCRTAADLHIRGIRTVTLARRAA